MIFFIASVINYRQIVADADSVLTILAENNEKLPLPGDDKPLDKDIQGGRRFSDELHYESRYFSVAFTVNGNIDSVNIGKIAAVDTETAVKYAQSVMKSGLLHGFCDDYRYMTYTLKMKLT